VGNGKLDLGIGFACSFPTHDDVHLFNVLAQEEKR
jgi:hypothetical protein